jgi:hypothetical protein
MREQKGKRRSNFKANEEERTQNEKENKTLKGHLSTLSILKDLRIGSSRGVRSPEEILFSVFVVV